MAIRVEVEEGKRGAGTAAQQPQAQPRAQERVGEELRELRERASAGLPEAREQGHEVAERTKQRAGLILGEQKEHLASQMERICSALDRTGENLRSEGDASLARYIDGASRRLSRLGRDLRDRDLRDIADDAQDFARRQPLAFFGAAIGAGFLLSRFFKSARRAS